MDRLRARWLGPVPSQGVGLAVAIASPPAASITLLVPSGAISVRVTSRFLATWQVLEESGSLNTETVTASSLFLGFCGLERIACSVTERISTQVESGRARWSRRQTATGMQSWRFFTEASVIDSRENRSAR